MADLVSTARVTLTVEIDTRDAWGPDCTVSQVHRQAEEKAANIIALMASEAREAGLGGIRVVPGSARVVMVTTVKP